MSRNDTSVTVVVLVSNDHVKEPDERLQVALAQLVNVTPGTATRVNGTIRDDDMVTQEAAVPRAGAWNVAAVAGALGGQLAYGAQAGATATFTFTGTFVEWVGARGPNRGRARVTLDGQSVVVDLYAPGQALQQSLFARELDLAQHTLVITVLGKKQAASSGKRVDLDAFRWQK